MATARQIAANRHNARRSSGPRSGEGKRRSSQNAYRHGLSAGVNGHVESVKDIEALASQIAGNSTDVVVLECARTMAQAEFDLARIRRLKVALVSRVMAFGEFEPPATFPSVRDQPILQRVRSWGTNSARTKQTASDANNRTGALR